jgi:O-antigen/teichoic acid export membrane protein
MITNIRNRLRTEFFKNLSTMMSGTILGQLVTIAAMPILSRLFTPEDFGLFALLFTTISVLGYIAGGTYDNAIVLPKENSDAHSLLKLCIIISLIFFVGVALLIPFLPTSVYNLLGNNKLKLYVWAIPFGVLLMGVSQAFTYYHNRQKNYKIIASNKVIQNTGVATVNITSGLINPSVWGLIGGFLTGQIISLFLLVKKANINISQIKTSKIKTVAREYANFPMFLAPMLLLNTFAINILVYLLAVFFDQTTVGLYSQAYKAINYPLYFITASYSIVFYQKLNESTNRKEIYKKSVLYSIGLGFLILLPVMIFGKVLFILVFGNQWAEAGRMAAILCPLTIISFAVGNVSEVFSVMRKNHLLLIWQVVYLVVAIAIIYFFKNHGIRTMLMMFSGICSILYLILAYTGYKIIKQ